jgi:uncharacterized protein
MSGEASDDPILRRICRSLRAIYGDRIERLVLFGSRARGDAHAQSDYDVAVFLEDLTNRWSEFHRLADLRTDILAETGAFLEAGPGGFLPRPHAADARNPSRRRRSVKPETAQYLDKAR